MLHASLVITKSGEVWQSLFGNLHGDILKAHGIPDIHELDYAKVEFSPPNKDVTIPIEKWIFKVAHTPPKWFSEPWAEEIGREALPRWERSHIFREGEHYIQGPRVSLAFLGTSKGQLFNLSESHVNVGQSAHINVYTSPNVSIKVSGNGFCAIEPHAYPAVFEKRATQEIELFNLHNRKNFEL
jgi:hypothetical protein